MSERNALTTTDVSTTYAYGSYLVGKESGLEMPSWNDYRVMAFASFTDWLAAHDTETRRAQAEADIALLHTHAVSLRAGLLSVDQIIQDIRNSVERNQR